MKGNVNILSSYRDIIVENVRGKLDIETHSGPVTVNGVEKCATIVSSCMPIQVRNIGGDLKVEGWSCSVTADNISGDVDVLNACKNVVIRRTSGSIVVSGSSSPIEVSRIKNLLKDGRIELITSYKPIKICLPSTTDVAISAYSRYGKIQSDFPFYVVNREDNKNNVEFKLGKGSISVRMETSADITIKRD